MQKKLENILAYLDAMKLHSFDLSQDSKKKEKELLDLAVDILSSILGNSNLQKDLHQTNCFLEICFETPKSQTKYAQLWAQRNEGVVF